MVDTLSRAQRNRDRRRPPISRVTCTCGRTIGTYRNGRNRPHLTPAGTRCGQAGTLDITAEQVRDALTGSTLRAAAQRLGTSPGTLTRRFGGQDWFDNRPVQRVRHTGPHPGGRRSGECPECREWSRRRYDQSEQGRAARARMAARREQRAAREAQEAADRRALADARAYVARMVASGAARNLRRALGIRAQDAEQRIGCGRTALNKIEGGRRPAFIRVRGVALAYAEVLHEWEAEAVRRGIDPLAPAPKLPSGWAVRAAKGTPSTLSGCTLGGVRESDPAEQESPMLPTMTVTNSKGRTFTVRYLPVGARYGLNDVLTVDDAPMVEFHDATYADKPGFGPLGQFVSRYYVTTLSDADGFGLDLDGGAAEWKIDADAMSKVRDWLAEQG